ncbi:TetR/AcrR family transcriptional regulator [Solicola gregarius]|uniref:TetR/AcrR family transcriptional regulator n=1 Tax=Solicola gregarius TaxID=2908642 RepID=A0AA46YKB8_9ACTN|nr:TetR/AcrR family transcriptional regulator [Solicola gregarius]UYM04316.1 TetR/AcrR family transcriptional regulator [Solicola gregarius]
MSRAEPVNARGRRTRTALLDAARTLVEEAGPESMTMASVADRAGVSRRAVYLHFASQPELVNALFDYVNEVEDIGAAMAPIDDAPDAATALHEFARFLATFVPRILPVSDAIYRAVRYDEGAATHWATAIRDRRRVCTRLLTRIAEEDALSEHWTVESGADMLLALISNDVIETLLDDCGWSAEQTTERLTIVFESTFISR